MSDTAPVTRPMTPKKVRMLPRGQKRIEEADASGFTNCVSTDDQSASPSPSRPRRLRRLGQCVAPPSAMCRSVVANSCHFFPVPCCLVSPSQSTSLRTMPSLRRTTSKRRTTSTRSNVVVRQALGARVAVVRQAPAGLRRRRPVRPQSAGLRRRRRLLLQGFRLRLRPRRDRHGGRDHPRRRLRPAQLRAT